MKKELLVVVGIAFLLICSSCKDSNEAELTSEYDNYLESYCSLMVTCQQSLMTPEQIKAANISKDEGIKQCVQGIQTLNSKRYGAVPKCERMNKAIFSAGLKCQIEMVKKYGESEMCKDMMNPDRINSPSKYQKELDECFDKYKYLETKQEKCICEHLDEYIEQAKSVYTSMGINDFNDEDRESLMKDLKVKCNH